MQSLCLRSGDLCFPFFRADYPHKLYGIPYGRFVFSPTIIYLLNHYQSSINISMESNVGFFFFWMSLPSGTITLFQAHLVSPFLSPKNNYFSRMSRSFYWRVVLETYLSATCVYCQRDVNTPTPTQMTENKVCVYILIFVYNISLNVSICNNLYDVNVSLYYSSLLILFLQLSVQQ